MDTLEKFNKVRLILSDWDPIGVGKPISNHEYDQYIPKILKSSGSEEQLRNCLIDFLIDMGLEGQGSNDEMKITFWTREIMESLRQV